LTRWRLAVVRARRVAAGGRPAAGVGASFQLEAAAVPVAGVDYDVGELSPELLGRLERTRAELLDSARAASAAGGRRRRGRRRRTLSLTVAALVTLTVVGAGATALMTGSTGVPAVDRLLGIFEAEREDARGRPKVDLSPSAPGPVIEMDLPGDGRVELVEGSTYVGRGGQICSATTQFARGSGQRRQGTAYCEPPSVLAADLRAQPLKVATIQVSGAVVLTGWVGDEVRKLSVIGPYGPVTARLSKPWLPPDSATGSVRSFLAIGSVGRTNGSDAEDAHRALLLESYEFRVTFEDGRTLKVNPR
jgi:hypothetical protein